jgi:excisionase family DNA binding protein
MNLQEPLLTTEDVANLLKVEVVTVRRLVGRGELAAYRVGGEYRFSQADVQDYLKRQYLPARSGQERFGAKTERTRFWVSEVLQRVQRREGSKEGRGAAGERFTDRAQAVLKATQEKAEAMGSDSIEPAHLLLGLATERGGLGSRALAEMGVTADQIEGVLKTHAAFAGEPRTGPEAPLKLGEATMAALRRAVDQANKLKHDYVGTEHLLLGLLADSQGAAVSILRELKIEAGKVRAHVQKLIREDAAGTPPPQGGDGH